MLGGISTISINRWPLYLIKAGNKRCTVEASKVGGLSLAWIESIEVVRDAKDTAVYGANGLIFI